MKTAFNWILALVAIAIFSFFAPMFPAVGIKFVFDRLFPIETVVGLVGAAFCICLLAVGFGLYIVAIDVYLIQLLPKRRSGTIVTLLGAAAMFIYTHLTSSSADDYLEYLVTAQLVFVSSVLYFGLREWDGVSEPKWMARMRSIVDRTGITATATFNGKLVPLTIETLKDDVDVLSRFRESIKRIAPDKILTTKDLVCSPERIRLAIFRIRLNSKASQDLGETLDDTEKLLSFFNRGDMTLQRALYEKLVSLKYV